MAEKKRYAVEYVGTYYVDAESEEEAKNMWSNADLGEGERFDITSVRLVA